MNYLFFYFFEIRHYIPSPMLKHSHEINLGFTLSWHYLKGTLPDAKASVVIVGLLVDKHLASTEGQFKWDRIKAAISSRRQNHTYLLLTMPTSMRSSIDCLDIGTSHGRKQRLEIHLSSPTINWRPFTRLLLDLSSPVRSISRKRGSGSCYCGLLGLKLHFATTSDGMSEVKTLELLRRLSHLNGPVCSDREMCSILQHPPVSSGKHRYDYPAS